MLTAPAIFPKETSMKSEKKVVRKLSLHRETLKNLNDESLRQVVGGYSDPTQCMVNGCHIAHA
jgi:hypothetical protein